MAYVTGKDSAQPAHLRRHVIVLVGLRAGYRVTTFLVDVASSPARLTIRDNPNFCLRVVRWPTTFTLVCPLIRLGCLE